MSQINLYLKLKLKQGGEVKGDSQAAGHKDEIILESFNWSEVNEGTSSGGSGRLSKTKIQDFHFGMRMNKASAPIMLAAANGDTVLEAVVAIRQANSKDNQDFLKWTLKDGLVTSYHTSASIQDLVPIDRFSIRFRELSVEFRPTQADGSLGATVSGKFDVGSL